MENLSAIFGKIDIYLIDQLLKDRIQPGMKIFDAGCGGGRNLVYFLREGYEVFGSDENPHAIKAVQRLATQLAPDQPLDHFRVESLEALSFKEESFDVVINNAVLHFAKDDAQFDAMLQGSWNVLKTGGLFFCRLGSTIGLEDKVKIIEGRRFAVPDGTERYLVDQAMLLKLTEELNAQLLDPLKTTIVQDQRCMTTWVLRKMARTETTVD